VPESSKLTDPLVYPTAAGETPCAKLVPIAVQFA